MSVQTTIGSFAGEFGLVVRPLLSDLQNETFFIDFMREMGWDVLEVPGPLQEFVEPVQTILEIIEADEITAIDIENLLVAEKTLFQLIAALKTKPDAAFAGISNIVEFKNEFPRQLIDFLIIDYLTNYHSVLASVLGVFGVIDRRYKDATESRPVYEHKKIVWEELPGFLEKPIEKIKSFYEWGENDFDAYVMLANIKKLATALNIGNSVYQPVQTIRGFLLKDALQAKSLNGLTIDLSLFRQTLLSYRAEAGLRIGLLPETSLDKPGIGILPYLITDEIFDFTIATDTSILVKELPSLDPGISVNIRPGKDVQLIYDITDPTGTGGSKNFILKLSKQRNNGIVLIGSKEGSKVEVKEILLVAGTRRSNDNKFHLFVEAGLIGASVVIKPSPGEADSFIGKLIPPDGIKADLDIIVGIDSQKGFYFSGSSSLEMSFPLHFSLGVVDVQQLTIAIKPGDGGIIVDTGVDIKTKLGPVTVAAQNIGVTEILAFRNDNSGNLGPIQLDIKFKPPTGAGLSIDAGGLKGGGVLNFDPGKEEYFGALELEFKDLFSLKAFGIINTRMPDGSKNFSLLIIITAEFSPIQLGFGFTLNGVGGLLGVNRTTKVEVLKEGIKTNTLKSILFPENVVANINRIVSDVKQVFPPQVGHFLICPMGKIGWGTPTLITLELGILIEIPASGFKILGVLKALLPEETNPLLRMQVNFLGDIDFDNKSISFDASLYDSKILTFTLTGDMALRLNFGDNPVFILSVGGFHPAFKEIPDDLRNMRRLTISLYDSSSARIIIQTYFAVTSNTAQFGAKAELFASKGSFNIYGFVSYDVLFQFSPFKFIADFGASVALRRHSSVIMSIHVSGQLSGPKPWDAKGSASVSFFFFSISVPFHVTWGDSNNEADKQREDILRLLEEAIADNRNWKAEIPASSKLHVSIRAIQDSSMAVHPFGVLTFSERIVPLKIEIKKFGNKLPKNEDEDIFTIEVNDGNLSSEDVREQFAPANFFDLKDADKLSRPSFEPMLSGFKVTGSSQIKAPPNIVKKNVEYEFSYLGKTKKVKPDKYKFPGTLFKAGTKSSAVAQSSLSHMNNRVSMNAPPEVTVSKEQFVIANISDMTQHGNTMVPSYTEALQMINQLIAEKPDLRDKLQVLSEFEINKN